MANLFRCGGGSSEEVKRVPCFVYEGSNGNTLTAKQPWSWLSKGSANTSKYTTRNFDEQVGFSGSYNMCDIDPVKILDCKWIIVLSGGGSTASGKFVSNYLMDVSNDATRIDFTNFKIELQIGELYFTPLHKIVGCEDMTNAVGSYVMYLAEVDKQKSSPAEYFAGLSTVNRFYMNAKGLITVKTSSYIWYNIQLIPLVESK